MKKVPFSPKKKFRKHFDIFISIFLKLFYRLCKWHLDFLRFMVGNQTREETIVIDAFESFWFDKQFKKDIKWNICCKVCLVVACRCRIYHKNEWIFGVWMMCTRTFYIMRLYKQITNKKKNYIRKYDHVKICKTLNWYEIINYNSCQIQFNSLLEIMSIFIYRRIF